MSKELKKIKITSMTIIDDHIIESADEPFETDEHSVIPFTSVNISSILNPIYDLIPLPKPAVKEESKSKSNVTKCTNPVHMNLMIKRNPGSRLFKCDNMCVQPHLQLTIELSDMNVNLFPAHYGYFDDNTNEFVLYVEKGGKDNFIHLSIKLVNCDGQLIKQNSLVNVDILDKHQNIISDKTFYLGVPNYVIGKFPGYAGSYRHKLDSPNFKSNMQLKLLDGFATCSIRFIKDAKVNISSTYTIRASCNNMQTHLSYPLNILTKCKYAEIGETVVLGKRKLLDDD